MKFYVCSSLPKSHHRPLTRIVILILLAIACDSHAQSFTHGDVNIGMSEAAVSNSLRSHFVCIDTELASGRVTRIRAGMDTAYGLRWIVVAMFRNGKVSKIYYTTVAPDNMPCASDALAGTFEQPDFDMISRALTGELDAPASTEGANRRGWSVHGHKRHLWLSDGNLFFEID